MTRTKINEQKEYLCGTALQRAGGGEIPAGKYKGNGFVRCKAKARVSSGCRGLHVTEVRYNDVSVRGCGHSLFRVVLRVYKYETRKSMRQQTRVAPR